jgi:hypothetical protein
MRKIPAAAYASSRSGYWLPAILAGTVIVFSLLAQDWIAGLGILILAAIWHFLRTDSGPPVLALALTMQWIQVTSAIYYDAIFGRRIASMDVTDYRPTVLIGLGCIVALVAGLRIGMQWRRGKAAQAVGRVDEAFPLPWLVVVYVVSMPVVAILQRVAFSAPALMQGILAISMLRYVIMYMVLRKLLFPEFRVGWFALVVLAEVAYGLTGFFAGFREPLFMGALALIERFNWRDARQWFAASGIAVLIVVIGLLWTAVKGDYRARYDELPESAAERLTIVNDLSLEWISSQSGNAMDDVDRMVDRMWPIYLPAMAVNRALNQDRPPLGGELLSTAIMHVLIPRLVYPDKPPLRSDSDMVRQFSGVMVAGEEQGTSIAFGYAGELFLDLGVPLMFLPVFIYGLFMGAAYTWFLGAIRHRDIAIAIVTVMFWLILYLFERSLAKTYGLTLTLFVYLGGLSIIIDRVLLGMRVRRVAAASRHR